MSCDTDAPTIIDVCCGGATQAPDWIEMAETTIEPESDPTCIFCGGLARATTRDHVPAKIFFRRNIWPEGHIFPACKACNDATRKDEQMLAFISRFGHGSDEIGDYKEWRDLNIGISKFQNEIWKNLLMRPIEKRRAIELLGIARPEGSFLDDIPLVKIPRENLALSMKRIGFKIGASLHYMHTRRIVSRNGGCFVSYRLNSNESLDFIFSSSIDSVFSEGSVARDKLDLTSQFWYRFAATQDGLGSMSHVLFRSSFSMIITVVADKDEALLNNEFPDNFWDDIVNPFEWNGS